MARVWLIVVMLVLVFVITITAVYSRSGGQGKFSIIHCGISCMLTHLTLISLS